MPDIIDVIQGVTTEIQKKYRPLPLDAHIEIELERLERSTRNTEK